MIQLKISNKFIATTFLVSLVAFSLIAPGVSATVTYRDSTFGVNPHSSYTWECTYSILSNPEVGDGIKWTIGNIGVGAIISVYFTVYIYDLGVDAWTNNINTYRIQYNYTTGIYNTEWDDVNLVVPIEPMDLTKVGNNFQSANSGMGFGTYGNNLTVYDVTEPWIVTNYTYNVYGLASRIEKRDVNVVQYRYEWQAPASGGIPFGNTFLLFALGAIASLIVIAKKKHSTHAQ